MFEINNRDVIIINEIFMELWFLLFMPTFFNLLLVADIHTSPYSKIVIKISSSFILKLNQEYKLGNQLFSFVYDDFFNGLISDR